MSTLEGTNIYQKRAKKQPKKGTNPSEASRNHSESLRGPSNTLEEPTNSIEDSDLMAEASERYWDFLKNLEVGQEEKWTLMA